MSGSSLDGLDVAFAELEENGGQWNFEIKAAKCFEYDDVWKNKLQNAVHLNAHNYFLLNSDFGKFCAEKINLFIEENALQYQVQLIGFHGHTTFHSPKENVTAQLGNAAIIAAHTGINVVSDLRSIDVAFGGEGAPIVPIGEKLLFKNFDYFLNIGGIANVSFNIENNYFAFDVCAANRVLNLLAMQAGKAFDEDGKIAATGNINEKLLKQLNEESYYKQSFPKSLSNNFGTEIIYPVIKNYSLSTADALRTYCEHIAIQIRKAFENNQQNGEKKLLITGGGALNVFLTGRIKTLLQTLNIQTIIPQKEIINFKEALIMGLIATLRWREENTVIKTVTGAKRNSIGGAIWIGQEA